jgi:hypothetical protein
VGLSKGEFERLRLVLSTFSDGTGWEKIAGNTLVGYRQFERALAEVLNGYADENKALFDVVATRTTAKKSAQVGYSCKLKCALEATAKESTVYIEVSNAVSQFTKHLKAAGLNNETDYRANPQKAGDVLLDWIKILHHTDATTRSLDLPLSVYLVLLYNKNASQFQLFEFPADVFLNGSGLTWTVEGAHIRATLAGKKAIEFSPLGAQNELYIL